MGGRGKIMPLTEFQADLARLLATNRTPESYLAGGAAINLEPNTLRYSNDLDFFNDSVERTSTTYAHDVNLLELHGYTVTLRISQPGYLSAQVSKADQSTRIDWAHDSAWRFLPTLSHDRYGYLLHPIDLAINKVLALAGRDEPRDFLDTLCVHDTILSLGALCWAGAGKDPGFSPHSLLELLKRRGKYHQSDFDRLRLAATVSLTELKTRWLVALASAERLINSRPMNEIGCLYYSLSGKCFVTPSPEDRPEDLALHYGKPGGVLPQVGDVPGPSLD